MTSVLALSNAWLLAMGAPTQQSGPAWVQFAPFLVILAIFYFIILRPMKSRQKKVQEFQTSLKVGDRVVTTSGIYGQIAKVGERSVQLQIAEKVRIEISKPAIGGYQGEEPVVSNSNSLMGS